MMSDCVGMWLQNTISYSQFPELYFMLTVRYGWLLWRKIRMCIAPSNCYMALGFTDWMKKSTELSKRVCVENWESFVVDGWSYRWRAIQHHFAAVSNERDQWKEIYFSSFFLVVLLMRTENVWCIEMQSLSAFSQIPKIDVKWKWKMCKMKRKNKEHV